MERNCGNCAWMEISDQMRAYCLHTAVKLERLEPRLMAADSPQAVSIARVELTDSCDKWGPHLCDAEPVEEGEAP